MRLTHSQTGSSGSVASPVTRRLRRPLALALAAVLMLSVCLGLFPANTAAATNILNTRAKNAILCDADTTQTLYEYQSTAMIAPGSSAMLMTALLILDYDKPDEYASIPSVVYSYWNKYPVAYFNPGDDITLKDCFYLLLMSSPYDVAEAVARRIAGSDAAFAEKMNARAESLGMTDTHYVDPFGMPNSGNFTTVRDIATLALYLWKNYPIVREVMGTKQYKIEASDFVTQTRYFNQSHEMARYLGYYYYTPCLGGKVFYTSSTGYCALTFAEKNEMTLMSIVMNCTSSYRRYTDSRTILNYGFSSFEHKSLELKDTVIGLCPIYDDEAMTKKVNYTDIYIAGELFYTVSKSSDKLPSFTITPHLDKGVVLPVSEDRNIGYLEYSVDGLVIGKAPCSVRSYYDLNAEERSTKAEEASPKMHLFSTFVSLLFGLICLGIVIHLLLTRLDRYKKAHRF